MLFFYNGFTGAIAATHRQMLDGIRQEVLYFRFAVEQAIYRPAGDCAPLPRVFIIEPADPNPVLEKSLKKIALLLILICLALMLDGTLSYDIFDLRVNSWAGWMGVLLALTIFAAIAWAESTKKSGEKNNRRN